ncbi:putative ferric-chelate reductase 1 isoform X2 [Ascaphus truei]|uniref:putative ferric-chelate reductase 1 isoform X2 n=1 Tax=Ascaphus truei TaxID=8439 RepID=UPI003F59E823
MNMKAHLVFVFCAGGYFATVFGYPSGKVSDSCDAMLPMHGKSVPQTLAAPYNVIVSNNTFSPGDVITVTLRSSSGNGFKGFLLEARSAGGDRITGAFTITDSKMTQGLPCSTGANSAVSHVNNNLKTSITAKWVAPPGAGPVRFRATVLQDYSTFWNQLESETLLALQISNSTCGSEKFCFSDPLDCSPVSSSCLFMSLVPSSEGFVFEMSGSSVGYLAIGFSDDQLMGNDHIYICTKNSSDTIQVQEAFSTGRVAPIVKSTSTVGSIVTSYVDGILKCSFITRSAISTQARTSFTNSNYYIFLTRGSSQAAGSILKHTQTPLITSQKVDLSSFAAISAQVGSSPLIRVHGALMIIAWMTTGNIGMMVARYMKKAARKPFLGKDLWFQTHFFLMVLTVAATIIAFILAFVEVNGWSSDTGAHPILGCIVMILAFLQPIVALFRPDPKSERRFIFNWGHMINAMVIKVLSVAAIFLGLQLLETAATQWMPKVMGGFFAWDILFNIILELNGRLKTKVETCIQCLTYLCVLLSFRYLRGCE